MPSGIGNWRRRENGGRFAGSMLREKRRKGHSPGKPIIDRSLAAEPSESVNTTPSGRADLLPLRGNSETLIDRL